MKKRYALYAVVLLVPLLAFSQEAVLRLTPYDGTPASFLNAQIVADTTANNGILPNRVYELKRGEGFTGTYLANAQFNVPLGATLRLRANDSAGISKPIIYLYPTGTGTTPQNPPGYFVSLNGGNLEMKNIVLSGYFEPVDTNLYNLQGGLIRIPTAGAGGSILLDGCIIKSCNGNHIRTDGAPRNIVITNCVFSDMGYLGRSNLGAGKGIDLRDASCDTLILEHNTFVNWQDRIIRHYNFSNPQAGTGPISYLRFNHNTLVNGMSYHGFLSLGNMGSEAIITNNLMIDPFSLGNDTDAVRQSEFVNSGELDPYGGARMNWIFTAPNDTTQWKISNNYYVVSDSGQGFYDMFASAGVTGEGAPLTWHINSRLGADSATAIMKLPSLALGNIPKLMTVMNRWYRDPNGGNKTKNTPGPVWNGSYDFDRRLVKYYADTLDCSYSTSSLAYSAAQGGFPVGDLNWFPSRYADWVNWVTGVDDQGQGAVPEQFVLEQNYPNPFNPATKITFSLPRESKVTLEVFDLLGRRVATLVNETVAAGYHTVEFRGESLGTGVYVYRLSGADVQLTKKMLLIK